MTGEGGASTDPVVPPASKGDGSGSQDPVIIEVQPAIEIVEWRQTNLDEWYEENIKSMDQAVVLGIALKDVGERCEIAIGKLANHVDKGKWNGGMRAFARGICIPFSTIQEWASSTKTPELTDRSVNLGTSKVAIVERSPEPEQIWEWVDEQDEPPTKRKIEERVKEQRMDRFYERLDENPSTRERPDPLYYTNVWEFAKPGYEIDKSHSHGIVFSEVLEHILYYFTEPEDLVVDPMAGTGPSGRICEEYNRKCLMYDIVPKNGVEYNDLRKGLPDEAQGCNHIYLDPPYFNMRVSGDFNDEIGEFYDFIRTIGEVCYDALCPGGTLSFVMMDAFGKKYDNDFVPLISDCYRILWGLGFECIARISSPYPEHISATGYQVNYAREHKRLVYRDRVIFIFRRPD